MMRGRIQAKVTDANLNYNGSITIDSTLCEQAGILPLEWVCVKNLSTGATLETYVILGEGICLNGAAARLAAVGDTVIITSYEKRGRGLASTASKSL